MDALAAPVIVAAALLVLAGVQKVVDPAPTVGALRGMGLPSGPSLVRAAAAAEALLGAGTIFTDQRYTPAAAAASYLGFAAFVEAARRKGAMVGSCGCFGHEDTPPSLIHVIVDSALAAVCAAWAVNGRGAPIDLVLDQPWSGIPTLGFCALAVWLLYAALTLLPRALHPTSTSGSRPGAP